MDYDIREGHDIFLNRDLSWLAFAERVLAFVEDPELPLLERVKFAGIMGVLHDEFFMKRVGGLKRMIRSGRELLTSEGRSPVEVLMQCREEVLNQISRLETMLAADIPAALADAGLPFLKVSELDEENRSFCREYFSEQIKPLLTPLAVDAEHPFPFISNLGLNLAVRVRDTKKDRKRFVRIKVPGNRPRWVLLPEGRGLVLLEDIIAENLDQLFPGTASIEVYTFRVTRGADSDDTEGEGEEHLVPEDVIPGSIIDQVTNELRARRFAGVVRLQVQNSMPDKLVSWLADQLGAADDDIYVCESLLGKSDLLSLPTEGVEGHRLPEHLAVNHPRLSMVDSGNPEEVFAEIRRGDILLHHPYQSFDTSVLRFIRAAVNDPHTLAIKLTIYRTSSKSPILSALVEAARQGKQVAVCVEITARFDEMPNIEWGRMLEAAGAHVSYGVEALKTHAKMALVVREEGDQLRNYVHLGTGNYHTQTARIYEDLGLLTANKSICEDALNVFNELTGAHPHTDYKKLFVAPRYMRDHFIELIRREAEHAREGRPSGIIAKMNQLQDPLIMRELYAAGLDGVPVYLIVRGLCCLRAGVPGLSDNIRVCSVLGRFLEHSRIYRFENAGEPEFYIGSADWMRRNLDKRVETIVPVRDEECTAELERILQVYFADNSSAWDMQPDGSYLRRHPGEDEEMVAVQEALIALYSPALPVPV
ncbi:polyphosphate kinase 1 [bacterium]|nr:polyphosphate kinase 1 [bacterium]